MGEYQKEITLPGKGANPCGAGDISMYNRGMTIAVIGAGPSGMAAALRAAWNGADVALFERNPNPGRKILVTGSGRCNLTNDGAAASRYTCADPAWMEKLIRQFGVKELLAMLREVGIPVYKTSDGWYYPLSNSAATVVDTFSSAMEEAKITLRTSTQVTSIQKLPKGFVIRSVYDGAETETKFDRIIVCAGGKAYPTLGSRGELFPILEKLGHTYLPKRPALAPVLADLGDLRTLQGVRLDVGVSLLDGSSQLLAYAAGNLIVTQWGLNGPAVMDISHQISAHPEDRLTLSLNLLKFCQIEYEDLFARKRNSPLPIRVFLEAFFPPKVASLYLRMAHLAENSRMNQMDDATLSQLKKKLMDTRVTVKGVKGFEFCQVSAGGIPVTEVDPLTLESDRVKGLFLAGETLDVVGPCGGYNLQFAFSSGALAGLAAAK